MNFRYPYTSSYIEAIVSNSVNGVRPIFFSSVRVHGNHRDLRRYSVVNDDANKQDDMYLRIQLYQDKIPFEEPITVVRKQHVDDLCIEEIH